MSSRRSESYDSSDSEPVGRTLRSAAVVVRRSTPPPSSRERGNWVEKEAEEPPKKKRKEEESDPLSTRTGGAYIPPARLRMMQEQVTDKSSVAYQRLSWEALKKSINGLINKVNVANIAEIIHELFQENIVRGRGLLARSVITAQAASPTFTHVYAALVAIINTKFPQIGELIASRLVLVFRRAFKRNDKNACLSSVRFIAHLVNQQVLHELLALEILTLLLEDPTNDSVEVAIGFLKECGEKLTELAPRGLHAVFESLKGILHDGSVDVRVQYMIEVMFAIRKDKFADHPAVQKELDLVDEEDNITHLISVEDELQSHDILNVFHVDESFLENEQKYQDIKAEILGAAGSDDEAEGSDSSEVDDDEEDEGKEEGAMDIHDETHTNLLGLRRTIYLTIMSSLDFEECVHKLLKMEIKPGQEMEVANMIIECCSQERSYQRFYGLLGERFCHLNQLWVEKFDVAFQTQYMIVHRLETNKLRNVAKFFAQLFYTDALPWTSLNCIHLNEEETNSSSRIFVKILFQELAEYMGLPKLNERLKDKFLSMAFEGLFPRDNPRNTRFAINFFTSIGLGGLTDDLREHLKNAPKIIMSQHQAVESSDTSSSSESDSEDSDDSSSSDSSSESSEESPNRNRHRGGRDGKAKVHQREHDRQRERSNGRALGREHERNPRERETRRTERHGRDHRPDHSPQREERRHHNRSSRQSPRHHSAHREERHHRQSSPRSAPKRRSPPSPKHHHRYSHSSPTRDRSQKSHRQRS